MKRIIERDHDPNGGQYIPINPQYDAGYADGFKAGKEYMRAEVERLKRELQAEIAGNRDYARLL